MEITRARTLVIAVIGSLTVHLVAAVLVRTERLKTPSTRVTPAQIIRVAALATPTPAPPTPTPAPPKREPRRPVSQPVHRSSAVASAQRSTRPARPHSGPSIVVHPLPPGTLMPPGGGPPGTASPAVAVATPTAPPTPACSDPDAAARALSAVAPDTPQDAVAQGATGTAQIRVDLNSLGEVVGVSVYGSTGSMLLDDAALEAARESRYAPEQHNCKPIAGSYLYKVDFR